MILAIWNAPFPDHSGFANRCRNVLEVLSNLDTVTVLCRAGATQESDIYQTAAGPVQLKRFRVRLKALERTEAGSYRTIFYELVRSIDLFCGFAVECFRLMRKHKGEPVRVYCVNAPLTIPLFVWLLTLVTGARRWVLEFHDLEPEMAMHMKRLTAGSLVLRVEYFLERFLVRRFEKIVVSAPIQAERIAARSGKKRTEILVFPNTVFLPHPLPSRAAARRTLGIGKDEVVFVYAGNLTIDYTITGLIDMIQQLPPLGATNKDIRVILAGDGDGLPIIRKAITEARAGGIVRCLGRIPDVPRLLAAADVGIIPWDRNVLSETILPTKLLEYLAAGLPVIVPDFGEFRAVVQQGQNGMRYTAANGLLAAMATLAGDRALRHRLGTGARQTFEAQFDPAGHARALAQALAF
ncbi:MAG: glycosyltransferase family 4 protein [Patescibacteria group bacterium]|nr:glycosyltransferase family 4 protein [Patescibacteria group bacterium]